MTTQRPSLSRTPIPSTQNANSITSDPVVSSEDFLKRLREFHRCRGTLFRFLPTIAGVVVDLQSLYQAVVSNGGWEKVNDKQLWSIIAKQFNIETSCLNGTQALKNIYIRYLYVYEKISNGENVDAHDEDDEDSKRRTVSHLQRVPHSYNHQQHNVADSARVQQGLFREFVKRSEYEKLELSLLSGFPNELTFTLNTLLLLSSNDHQHPQQQRYPQLRLYKCPRILDILFHHMGLFLSENSNSHLQLLYENIWSKHVNYHLRSYWFRYCPKEIVTQILGKDDKKLAAVTNPSDENGEIILYNGFNGNAFDADFDHDIFEQNQELRVEQILMVIRNLSFDRANAQYLLAQTRNNQKLHMIYQFLLLTAYCERKEIQKYAFDIITNLAQLINLKHLEQINENILKLFIELIRSMLFENDDRLKIIRSLEIIGNLTSQGMSNELFLLDYIDIIVKKLIHIPDILILVHTLECLYRLSELGEQACNQMLKVDVIVTLINLLTIEAKSFSSQTIKTIKIVEMSAQPVLMPYQQPVLATMNGTTQHQVSNSTILVQTTQPPSTQQQQQQQQQQPQTVTYAVENTETNKSYYGTNNKLILQQQQQTLAKPPPPTLPLPSSTIIGVTASGNLLSGNNVFYPPTQSTSLPNNVTQGQQQQQTTIVINNLQQKQYVADESAEKKRKLDSISETIASVVNGYPSSLSPTFLDTQTQPSPAKKRSRSNRQRRKSSASSSTINGNISSSNSNSNMSQSQSFQFQQPKLEPSSGGDDSENSSSNHSSFYGQHIIGQSPLVNSYQISQQKPSAKPLSTTNESLSLETNDLQAPTTNILCDQISSILPPELSICHINDTSTTQIVHSIVSDIIDQCIPLTDQEVVDIVKTVLSDLCQRISERQINYNQIPSPVFKRKMETDNSSEHIKLKRTRALKAVKKLDQEYETMPPPLPVHDINGLQQSESKPKQRTRNRRQTIKTENHITSVTVYKTDEQPHHQIQTPILPVSAQSILPTTNNLVFVKSTASLPNVLTPTPAQPSVSFHPQQQLVQQNGGIEYQCEWEQCRKLFPSARSVFHHCCSQHVKTCTDNVCQWLGCDRIRRQKWALISHIQERHCSEAAFRHSFAKKQKQQITTTPTTATPPPVATTSTTGGQIVTGYAPDAAWLAVRRHMQIPTFDELPKNKEGPLTKSIRLTAALILRNIAHYSATGKQNLRQYEHIIANLALDPCEASNALTSCLWELYN
ncbi:unnamed protein product [Didymodactylos carnosus]|uniref:ARID domain-containing protein n=1 Tax=Didymodactylos carnosus TaxID=1234261 RepID=A0A813V8Q4_9BILA|nr:unnamed protein product [Didymodactylos carnosus]CAF0834228.1 unnamed protein product [Didymodactylos carnosus]CAF3569254.1 unnamed protein product [Didymodactylos carnosus]CAF3621360.1 unnamed protein product [Didymodactylos carnosus]